MIATFSCDVARAVHRWADSFSDFDEMAERIAAWDVVYQQLAPGPFRAEVALTASSSAQLLSLHWSSALSNHGSAPAGKRAFGIPMRPWGPFRFDGADGRRDAVMTGRGGTPFHLLTHGRIDLIVASFDLPLLESRMQARFGCDEAALGRPRLLRARDEAILVAAGQALDALARAMAAATPETLAWLEARAADIVLSTLLPPEAPAAEPPRRRLARRVEEVLRDRLADPPGIGELCALTGATERTLHLAFREAYDTSPVAHLRLLRLNAARRALLRGREPSVSFVAMRFGFFHLGRFAGDYAKLFGETPSATFNQRINAPAGGR